MKATGGCLCGKIRFTVRGDVSQVVFCHCPECRALTGNYVATTEVKDADLEVTGAENLIWHPALHNAERGFARCCGSLLFWKAKGSETTSIMAGMYDEGTPLNAGFHIRTADKPPWYEINDGLPQYEGSVSAGQAESKG